MNMYLYVFYWHAPYWVFDRALPKVELPDAARHLKRLSKLHGQSLCTTGWLPTNWLY